MSKVNEYLLSQSNIGLKTSKLQIGNLEIDYYICERKNSILEYDTISKYIIFDLLDHKDLLAKITKPHPNRFEKFQQDYLAPIFFSHRDDLRWNVYTLFITNEIDKFKEEITFIEKNNDYARKLVLDFEQFYEFMEYGYIGNLDTVDEKGPKTDFVLEWENILAKEELSGCLYNKISEKSIKDYIIESKGINPVGRPTRSRTSNIQDDNLVIEHINRMKVSGFRSHCLGEDFTYIPGDINLFSGPNGSGKTSLCEAIELGLTGKIKTNRVDKKNKVNISCSRPDGNDIEFKSSKTPKEERSLDLAWYGTTTTGNKSRLNENFSIFNYLNSNASHKFSDKKIDLNLLL